MVLYIMYYIFMVFTLYSTVLFMSIVVVLIIVKIYYIRRARIRINDEMNGGCDAIAIAAGFAMI